VKTDKRVTNRFDMGNSVHAKVMQARRAGGYITVPNWLMKDQLLKMYPTLEIRIRAHG